jgi:hypothetical protein
MVHYAQTGVAVTGATYAKQAQGPVPKQVLPAIENLVQQGRLTVQNVSYFDLVKRYFTTHGDNGPFRFFKGGNRLLGPFH